MPSLVPKRKPVLPVVDLKALFIGEQCRASRERVIDYLARIYRDHSDGSFERVSRPGVITEQFFLFMPTEAAFKSEVDLCNGILNHSLGNIGDDAMRELLSDFIGTHTFVYEGESRRVKSGEWRWQDGVELSYVNSELLDGWCCNAIQERLLVALEKKLNNKNIFKSVKL